MSLVKYLFLVVFSFSSFASESECEGASCRQPSKLQCDVYVDTAVCGSYWKIKDYDVYLGEGDVLYVDIYCGLKQIQLSTKIFSKTKEQLLDGASAGEDVVELFFQYVRMFDVKCYDKSLV